MEERWRRERERESQESARSGSGVVIICYTDTPTLLTSTEYIVSMYAHRQQWNYWRMIQMILWRIIVCIQYSFLSILFSVSILLLVVVPHTTMEYLIPLTIAFLSLSKQSSLHQARGLGVRPSSRINNVNRCLEMVGCVHISMLVLLIQIPGLASITRDGSFQSRWNIAFSGGDPSCDEFKVCQTWAPYIYGTDYRLLRTEYRVLDSTVMPLTS